MMKRIIPLLLLALPVTAIAQTPADAARRVYIQTGNASPTGATLLRLAKLTGAPSKATITSTSDTGGAVGVVVEVSPSNGVTIQVAGDGQCDFDASGSVAGDYVQISATTAGKCHSAGSTYPTSGQVVGRAVVTRSGAGAYPMIFSAEVAPASGGGLSGLTSGQYLKATGASSVAGDGVKRYLALLTQTGTGAPAATVLENSLGGTVVWARSSAGTYTATLAGVFTSNKTALIISNNDAAGSNSMAQFSLRRTSADVLTLNALDANWAGTEAAFGDDLLSGTTVEIRVFP